MKKIIIVVAAVITITAIVSQAYAGPFGLFGRRSGGCANGSCSSNQAVVQPVVPSNPCCNCNCGCDLCKCKTECCANDKGCCDCQCGCPNCKCKDIAVGSCKDNSTCSSGTCGPNNSSCSSNYGYSSYSYQTTQTTQTTQTNRQVYRRGNGPIRKIIKKIFHR